jgi:hypothetical protein
MRVEKARQKLKSEKTQDAVQEFYLRLARDEKRIIN